MRLAHQIRGGRFDESGRHVDGRHPHARRVVRTPRRTQREIQQAHEHPAVDIATAVDQFVHLAQAGERTVVFTRDGFDTQQLKVRDFKAKIADAIGLGKIGGVHLTFAAEGRVRVSGI